jgi:hypothetical protein
VGTDFVSLFVLLPLLLSRSASLSPSRFLSVPPFLRLSPTPLRSLPNFGVRLAEGEGEGGTWRGVTGYGARQVESGGRGAGVPGAGSRAGERSASPPLAPLVPLAPLAPRQALPSGRRRGGRGDARGVCGTSRASGGKVAGESVAQCASSSRKWTCPAPNLSTSRQGIPPRCASRGKRASKISQPLEKSGSASTFRVFLYIPEHVYARLRLPTGI